LVSESFDADLQKKQLLAHEQLEKIDRQKAEGTYLTEAKRQKKLAEQRLPAIKTMTVKDNIKNKVDLQISQMVPSVLHNSQK
jgi:hypothetical protein